MSEQNTLKRWATYIHFCNYRVNKKRKKKQNQQDCAVRIAIILNCFLSFVSIILLFKYILFN